MSIFKSLVAKGADYLHEGADNFASWSELMIHDGGPNVRPFLHEVLQWSLLSDHKRGGAKESRVNCWDYRKCGRHNSGNTATQYGICPVFLDSRFNGIYTGKNGGRVCWLIKGTRCGGWVQHSMIHKYVACSFCDFKKAVISEEKPHFIISDAFLRSLFE